MLLHKLDIFKNQLLNVSKTSNSQNRRQFCTDTIDLINIAISTHNIDNLKVLGDLADCISPKLN